MNFKLSFFLLSCPIKIEPKSAIFETKAISSIPEYPNINRKLNTKETINNIPRLFNILRDLLNRIELTPIVANITNNFIELSTVKTLVNRFLIEKSI